MASIKKGELGSLAVDVYKPQNERGLTNWNSINGIDKSSGLQINTYQDINDTHVKVFGIAGTNGMSDIPADVGFSGLYVPAQVKEALEYVASEIQKDADTARELGLPNTNQYSATGHSLGGGISQLISYAFGIGGLALDSPGAQAVANNPDFPEYLGTLKEKYPDAFPSKSGVPSDFLNVNESGSAVSAIGTHIGNVETINAVSDSKTMIGLIGIAIPVALPFRLLSFWLAADSVLDNHDKETLTRYIKENYDPKDLQFQDSHFAFTKYDLTPGNIENITPIPDGYGEILNLQLKDGRVVYYVPNEQGKINVIAIDKDGNITRNDFETNDNADLLLKADAEAKDYANSIDTSKLDKYADSGQIKSDAPSDVGGYDAESQTFYIKDENGNIQAKPLKLDNNITIYGNPSNPDKITFSDEKGYQVWEKNKDGEFVQTNAPDYSQIANTAINQIGSLIIASNENFSNIEKIAVSTTVKRKIVA